MQWGWATSSLNISYGPPPTILTHNNNHVTLPNISIRQLKYAVLTERNSINLYY